MRQPAPPAPAASPPPSVHLQFSGPHGPLYETEMRGPHCSIGSGVSSQVVIDRLGLEDKHAIVHNVGGVVTLTACPDADVSVNGKEVTGTVRLKDGDSIGLGHKLSATVNIRSVVADSAARPPSKRSAEAPPALDWARAWAGARAHLERSVDWKVLVAALGALLLLAIALVLWTRRDRAPSAPPSPASVQSASPKPAGAGARPADPVTPVALPTGTPAASAAAADPGAGSARTDKVRSVVKRVMRRIGREEVEPYVDDAVAADVEHQLDAYVAGEDVARLLSDESGSFQAVADLANRENLEPSLLILASLLEQAEAGRDAGGRDLAATARAILPQLKRLAIYFNSNDADSCLLIVAARQEVEDGRRASDILLSLRENVRDPKLERNFKYLYDRGGLSRRAYEHVIRFLALGALALEPRAFGIEGKPLPF